MSDILSKRVSTVTVVPGKPGIPGVPEVPAGCIDREVTSTAYTVYYYDASGEQFPQPGAGLTPFPVAIGTSTTTVHECWPGSPGVAGVPGTPPVVEVAFNLGWNGSATSIGTLEGDQMFQFSLDESNVGAVVGLNDVNEGSGYIEMEHALYGASGKLQVVENGTVLTTAVAYRTSDVLTIARLGGQVRYWLNSTLLYTSLVPSTGTKFIDVSLYCGGDKVY